MFNVGFGELFIILLVIILFFKPKDIAKASHTIGLQVNTFKRLWFAFWHGLNEE